MEYLLVYLIVGVVCGFVCMAIASSRNMNGGFWWGFWLGIIGIIIVAVRPNDNYSPQASNSNSYDEQPPYATPLKSEAILKSRQEQEKANNVEKNISEADRIKHIKEYKELLDAGIISQQEFEKKKTQLLWENTVETDIDCKEESKKDCEYGVNPKGEKAVYLLPADREDFGTCPKCGSTQPKGRHVCWKCGVPLMYDA